VAASACLAVLSQVSPGALGFVSTGAPQARDGFGLVRSNTRQPPMKPRPLLPSGPSIFDVHGTATPPSFPSHQLRVGYGALDPQGAVAGSQASWTSRIRGWIHPPTPANEVLVWRAAAGMMLASALVFRKAIDCRLAALWSHLMTGSSVAARVFRTDSYEWCLAVAAFVVWIHGFMYADVAVDRAARRNRVHPWRKYRLQDRFEADRKRRTFLATTSGASQRSTNPNASGEEVQPDIRTKQSAWNGQAWLFELWVYVLPLLTWDLLAPRRHRRLAPFGAPTTLGILGGVTFGLVLYDFLFFCGHYVMHKVPWIYRTVHAKHHKVQEVRAGEIVRLSLVEEVLEVGFSIVALNLLGVHPLARSIYNCVITFLLTELHCGFDFPWSPQNVVPFGLATGSRRHHYHHRFGRHYYQKFFFTFDRLFGFYQKDDGTLHGDSVKATPYIPPSWQGV
jgi:sterol desaturase/sphingolipid hydroxylase (fatty acid hydroxylase superfamily)